MMDRTLEQLPYLLDLSKRFERNIHLGIKIALYPGLFVLGGIFAFGWSFATVGAISVVVLFTGVSLAVVPLVRERFTRNGLDLAMLSPSSADDV